MYKEKLLKFYFKLEKNITNIRLVSAVSDDPQITSVFCYNRKIERYARYKECIKKKKLMTDFILGMRGIDKEKGRESNFIYFFLIKRIFIL